MKTRIELFEIIKNEKCYKGKYKNFSAANKEKIFNTIENEIDCFEDFSFKKICQKLPLVYNKLKSYLNNFVYFYHLTNTFFFFYYCYHYPPTPPFLKKHKKRYHIRYDKNESFP